LLQDRHQRLAEAAERILRLPDVDDAEAARALPGDVGEEALDRPVRGRVETALPSRHLADGLLVSLLRETRRLEHGDDWHWFPPRVREPREHTIGAVPKQSSTTYVVLLRGINIGPRNRIAMPDLRELLESAGFDDVQTYAQSGNVVLSSGRSADGVAREVERLIRKRFGL